MTAKINPGEQGKIGFSAGEQDHKRKIFSWNNFKETTIENDKAKTISIG